MEGEQKTENRSFKLRKMEYVFPLEKEGKTIDRHVVIFPTKETVDRFLGENPEIKLKELVAQHSDSEIAEKLSTDEFQLTTFLIMFLRYRLKVGENRNRSLRPKIPGRRVQIAVDSWHSGIAESLLEPKEEMSLVLGFLMSTRATTKELTRLLGYKSEKKTNLFLKNMFDKLERANIVK